MRTLRRYTVPMLKQEHIDALPVRTRRNLYLRMAIRDAAARVDPDQIELKDDGYWVRLKGHIEPPVFYHSLSGDPELYEIPEHAPFLLTMEFPHVTDEHVAGTYAQFPKPWLSARTPDDDIEVRSLADVQRFFAAVRAAAA